VAANKKHVKIAASLLAAEFGNLRNEIRKAERGGCDWLHIDVMDGHFVPNLTIGPFIVRAIRKIARVPLDTHLMIARPERYVKAFAEAGSDVLTVHAEACRDLGKTLDLMRSFSLRCGVAIRPATPLSKIERVLKRVDLVLLMTVNPGFGGQAFMPEVLPKIRDLRKRFSGDIEVDGGINAETAAMALDAGANVLVAGTSVFGRKNLGQAIRELRGDFQR
jgi:ribulose-phosphate 3-epimerase